MSYSLVKDLMTCQIVIYTHSEYQDIWQISKDFVEMNSGSLEITFAVNKGANIEELTPFQVYFYDDQLPYAGRLAQISRQIQSDYIVLFHDIDILVDFDEEKWKVLFEWIQAKSVDRFSFGIYPSSAQVSTVDNIPIAKLAKGICEWFSTPYDVGPCVWKRSTLLEIMEEFSEETYRTIESSGIQERLSEKQVYGFAKKELEAIFTIGRPFTKWFTFCHILVRGKWVPPDGAQGHSKLMYFLFSRYSLDATKRGFADFYIGMENGFTIE